MPPSTGVPSGADGIVVEGLVYGCGTPTATEAAQATVAWLNEGWLVWTEMSIYGGCDKSIAQFKNDVATIIGYVINHTPEQYWHRWLGIMLDEESSWGFSVNSLVDLNAYTANALNAYAPRPTWFSTESFSGQGDWTQNSFNAISYVSYPAPQIATSYMVQLTNSFYQSFGTPTLVTWSTVYPPAYNSEAESVNAVNGAPYAVSMGGKVVYYDNQFCPGSCM